MAAAEAEQPANQVSATEAATPLDDLAETGATVDDLRATCRSPREFDAAVNWLQLPPGPLSTIDVKRLRDALDTASCFMSGVYDAFKFNGLMTDCATQAGADPAAFSKQTRTQIDQRFQLSLDTARGQGLASGDDHVASLMRDAIESVVRVARN